MAAPEFVRITNTGATPFDFHQNNQKRIIEPGGDAIIPWHLAAALFGSPGITNTGNDNARVKAYNKVRGYFGFAMGLTPETDWEFMRPNISVIDLSTNERIYMLIEDLEGKHIAEAPGEPDTKQDAEALHRQIAVLQAQMQQLLNASHAQPQQAASATNASPTVTTDSPDDVPDLISAQFTDIPDNSSDDGDLTAFGIDLSSASTEPTVDSPQAIPTGGKRGNLAPRP